MNRKQMVDDTLVALKACVLKLEAASTLLGADVASTYEGPVKVAEYAEGMLATSKAGREHLEKLTREVLEHEPAKIACNACMVPVVADPGESFLIGVICGLSISMGERGGESALFGRLKPCDEHAKFLAVQMLKVVVGPRDRKSLDLLEAYERGMRGAQ